MQLGLVGLGRMGANMRERLREHGHDAIGYDPGSEASDVATLGELVAALSPPRIVWLMVPAGEVTRSVIAGLAERLQPGDLVVDGGNSRYTDDPVNAALLGARGVRFVDCGVSGGVWGRDNGYALMVGGNPTDIEFLAPVFDALRPPGPRANSFVHAGPVGAGHYAKMVHNGIEYGLMHAYAEGYELLLAEDSIADPGAVLQAWTAGTVVRSWLLDLLVDALSGDPELASLTGYTEDSGEGRWSVEEAIAHAVPVPVISAALFARFASRQSDSPTMKAVSALRRQFGGHAVEPAVPAADQR
ncbi:phosphogluconate dehydrogenase (NAD(+)-dependent, decarboxylating) [[Mycobacterium] wendilense]|uniref:Decarboxylating 6-phosphogluconate dehydrogenase n=1 Tax=[Mycobacterium] wendilense TaxID=3064284 RepID=A0ABM9M9Z6_9MYCO|nr:decarboxylating 6-phosphogluconate dehydrogenase [Mycolicibacterium sp. MU0050]CAJ1580036.1 decarboxylating 6-phosphogluconate dehydrogenase [Mycolicibacterium sp. MU0050]